jgi:hypothetical protein
MLELEPTAAGTTATARGRGFSSGACECVFAPDRPGRCRR